MDIGPVGLWTGLLDAHPTSRVRELAVELEEMGWPCLWRPETSGRDAIVSCTQLLEATSTLRVATGIAQIHARHPLTTRNAQRTLHESSGGRFLLGLGVSHAPFIEAVRKVRYDKPYTEMSEYLAAMQQAPFTAVAAIDEPPTVLAALGPRMLQLSAEAAQGAHPYFSPVEHTAFARDVLGAGPLLAPEVMVVVDDDRTRATATARKHMERYLQLPNYTNNLRRFGFGDDDHPGPSGRLIDAIVVRGSIDDVVRRVGEHREAGADHVCIQVLTPDLEFPMRTWSDLADAFGLR
ncbi:MAG: TIGR03620 family F420-dependent LLM class oxidoreductase [Ilumatobacteraceae bacterium]